MNLMRILNGVSPEGFEWLGDKPVDPQAGFGVSAIIGPPNFVNIWWLEKAINVAQSIARVKFLTGGSATGFLIAPDILMTNHHVFEDEQDAQNAVVQFNYRLKNENAVAEKDEWECDPEGFFKANRSLDYAIVKLKAKGGQKAGDVWGFLNLPTQISLAEYHRVNIIQHPQGRWQEIAFRDNQVKAITDTVVQYITDTDYGSSGSPVFDDYFNIVALHNQRVRDPNTQTWYRNQGYRIDRIVEDIGDLLTA